MAGHAIITGGSSGIGLAAASELMAAGLSISLIARSEGRLKEAADTLTSTIKSGARVRYYAADVAQAAECELAVQKALADQGPPEWAIASAGIVRPGLFAEQSLDDHREQMGTNYFGALHLARSVYQAMAARRQGRLVLISSGAAMVGLYGYASYGPSKFALRGLAETLRVELRPKGISVTLVYPGDTQTPQFEAELPLRPKVTSKMAEGAKVLPPDIVARKFIRQAGRGKFLVTYGLQLHALSLLQGMIAPVLRGYQNHLAKRYEPSGE